MLYWAIVFFVIAIVAAIFGFGGIAAGAAGIAKILFVIFLIGSRAVEKNDALLIPRGWPRSDPVRPPDAPGRR